MKLIYETEHLFLKVLDHTHADKVVDYLIRNKDFFSDVEPIREDDFYTYEVQAEQMLCDMNYINNKSMLRLWMFKKNDLDKIIGQITFYNIVPYAFQSCHVGYRSDKNNTCKGLITEAVQAGIQIMFMEYNMHRIEAHVIPHNSASIRVLEKLGFLYEGIAYKFLEVNGKWEDHLHFALINDNM